MPPILPGVTKNSQYITNNSNCSSNDVTNLSVNESKLYNIAAPTNDATQSLLLYICSMYHYTTHTYIHILYITSSFTPLYIWTVLRHRSAETDVFLRQDVLCRSKRPDVLGLSHVMSHVTASNWNLATCIVAATGRQFQFVSHDSCRFPVRQASAWLVFRDSSKSNEPYTAPCCVHVKVTATVN